MGMVLIGVGLAFLVLAICVGVQRRPPSHQKGSWMGMDVGVVTLVMTLLGRR